MAFCQSSLCLIRSGQTGRSDGISGGAQCMRTHVANGCGLTRGPGGSGGCGRFRLTGSSAVDKSPTYLDARVQLPASKRPGSGNRSARAAIIRSFGFKHPQDPFGAICGPRSEEAPIRFAKRLR